MSNNQSRWYFSKEALINTPSRKCGIDYDKELSYRQQAANLIQDMGILLKVDQLCINTAIVYMHRFYIFHSFQRFHRNVIAACALFLAAKVEEQPRESVIVVQAAHSCLHPNQHSLDPKSDNCLKKVQQLVVNENIMLQTLGFDVRIKHPHFHVLNCCQLVKASKDLAQTSYFMATDSLHLTTMCLQHPPSLVACVCIHLAYKWSNWEVPVSSNEKETWMSSVKELLQVNVTTETLDELTAEFSAILVKYPSHARKILARIESKNKVIPNHDRDTSKDEKLPVSYKGTKSKALPSALPPSSYHSARG